MSGSDEERPLGPPRPLHDGDRLLDWRINELEASIRHIREKDLPKIREEIQGERNWRFLVTGGVGAGSAFITWVVSTWRGFNGHP